MVSLSRSLASVAWLPLPTMPRRRCSRSTNPSTISNNNYNGVATRVRLLVLVVAVVVVALAAPSEQVNVYMPDQTELVHLDAAVGVFAKQQVTDNTPASAFYDEGYEHGVTTLLLQSTYRDQDAGATGNAGKRYQWDHEFIDPPHVSIVGVWETAGDDEELRQHLRLLPSGSMSTKELELQLAGEAVTPLTFPDVRSHRQGHALDLQYIDGADSIPYLNVVYVCKVPLSKLLIRLAVPVFYVGRERGGASASFNTTAVAYWTKSCGMSGTQRLGLTIGHKGQKIVDDGIVIADWQGTHSLPTIDSEQRSSQFDVFIEGNHGSEFYPTPTITVQDSSVLTATVGGEAADGFVADQFPKRIIVYYNCLSDGTTRVQLTLASALFRVVRLSWIKQCGVVEDKGTIDVGTHAQTPNDVVENGVAHIEWSVARPSVVLKEDVRSTLFFVSTSEESAKVHFSAPVITVTPPNAMQVVVSGNMQKGGIATSSPQRFVLNFVCSRRIDATVRVTLQLEHHGLVEFAFKKKCVYRAPKESVSFTANELLVMTSLSVMFISVFVWYYWFRRTKVYRLLVDEFCFC